MKLGLVTYNLANKWDLVTLIERCKSTGFEESGIILWGLGSICDFHSDDPAVVKQNIQTCKDFVLLAKDLGAKGVKVRPNGLQEAKGIPIEKTLEQIGLALNECGKFAANHGIEIWLEVHGPGTCHPPHVRTILDHCNHPSVGACWNSNQADIKDGSVKEYFNLLRKDLKSCHINELWREDYPWRELFSLLKKSNYERFTLAEIPESGDPEKVMRYYRALWTELAS